MTIVQICLAIVVLLVVIIEAGLWNEKVVYFGGWKYLLHALFGRDKITKLRDGLWIITSPGGYNPGTNMYGTRPNDDLHIKLYCGDAGVWSPSRIRAIQKLMREEKVDQLSDFIMGHPHPDHIGGLPELLKLGTQFSRIFTSSEDSWHLTDPCGSPNLPERMNAIMNKVGARYLGWPLNTMYWIYPVYAWNIFGSGACGIDRYRFSPLDDGKVFRFNGYYLRVFKLGGHSPGELTFVAVPDNRNEEAIVLSSDLIDLTDTERRLLTPMPLPEGHFAQMALNVNWLINVVNDLSVNTIVFEHGGIIRGQDNIINHLDRVLVESNKVIAAVIEAWPEYSNQDFSSFAVSIFKTLGYKPTPALTAEEMASIVASVAIAEQLIPEETPTQ